VQPRRHQGKSGPPARLQHRTRHPRQRGAQRLQPAASRCGSRSSD